MDVGQYVRNVVVTPCDLEQLKDADIGSEQIQVKMDSRSRSKGIGEIFFGHMLAR